MKLLENSSEPDSYAKPVLKQVAEKFEALKCNLESKAVADALKDKLKVPLNCKFLTVPKVNPEIWNQLVAKARTNDLKYQTVQLGLSKGLVSLINTTNFLSITPNSFTKESNELMMMDIFDGASALLSAFKEMNVRRKQEIRPYLRAEYAAICSTSTDSSEYLFGDNIVETLKSTKSVSTVLKGAVVDKTERRYAPYLRVSRGSLNFNRSLQRGRGSARFRSHQFARGMIRPQNQQSRFGTNNQHAPQ